MRSQIVLPVNCLGASLGCPVYTALRHLDSLFLSLGLVLIE